MADDLGKSADKSKGIIDEFSKALESNISLSKIEEVIAKLDEGAPMWPST